MKNEQYYMEFINEQAKLYGSDIALILVLIIMPFPIIYFFTIFVIFLNFIYLLYKHSITLYSNLQGDINLILALVIILKMLFAFINIIFPNKEKPKTLKFFNDLILKTILLIFILSFTSIIILNPLAMLPLNVYFITYFITNSIYEYEKSQGKDYSSEDFENLLNFNISILALTLLMSALGSLAAPIAIFLYTIFQIANNQILDINLDTAGIILCSISIFITPYIPITIGLTLLLIDKILLLFFNINLSLRHINSEKGREVKTLSSFLSSFLIKNNQSPPTLTDNATQTTDLKNAVPVVTAQYLDLEEAQVLPKIENAF